MMNVIGRSKRNSETIEMFMDHIDFDMKPWDIEDPETDRREFFVKDKNILGNMYELKNLYEKQQAPPQPHSYKWNFGSVPSNLLKKKS